MRSRLSFQSEYPRERLLRAGAHALTDSELLAVLLRTGTTGRDVLSLAGDLLAQFGNLRSLFVAPGEALTKVPGVGVSKVCTLLACRELARRLQSPPAKTGEIINNTAAAASVARQHIGEYHIEVCGALFVDLDNQLLGFEQLATGSMTEVVIYPRELIRRALLHDACGVILVHTHPGGDCRASAADIALTTQVAVALAKVDIQLLDHIILAGENSCSLAQQGLMEH